MSGRTFRSEPWVQGCSNSLLSDSYQYFCNFPLRVGTFKTIENYPNPVARAIADIGYFYNVPSWMGHSKFIMRLVESSFERFIFRCRWRLPYCLARLGRLAGGLANQVNDDMELLDLLCLTVSFQKGQLRRYSTYWAYPFVDPFSKQACNRSPHKDGS